MRKEVILLNRTPLSQRKLPDYTRGEERFNMISHIVGAGIAIAGMVLCIIRAALHHNGYGVGSSIVFGVSMLFMYTMSSLYHGLRDGMAKRVLQVLDHCSIYVVIAGSYTPVLLSAMRPLDARTSWILFYVVWGLAAAAIVLNSIDLHRWRKLSMALYIGMGWTIIVRLPLLLAAIGWGGFALLLAGGICYTAGAVLYGKGKKRRWMHSVFHLFVVFGSICHILAILLFAL